MRRLAPQSASDVYVPRVKHNNRETLDPEPGVGRGGVRVEVGL